MNYKLYIIGNYFFIEEIIANGNIFSAISKNVQVLKSNVSEDTFYFKGIDNFENKPVSINNLKDIDGNDFDINTFKTFYTSNTGNFNSGEASPQNAENIAKIITTCGANDFQNAHGTTDIYNRIFIGTRVSNRIAMYYDKNNLSDKTILDVPEINPLEEQGVEAACSGVGENKFYALISNTTKLIQFNDINNLSDYTIFDFPTLGLGVGFGGSGSILTDGLYLYIASEKSSLYPNPSLIKIQLSDKSVISVTPLTYTNGNGTHTGVMTDIGYALFACNGAGGEVAVVDTSTMDFTIYPLGIDGITDDSDYIPPGFTISNPTAFFISENPTTGNKCLAKFNLDDFSVQTLDLMPSLCVKVDVDNGLLYSACRYGYIEVVDLSQPDLTIKSISDVYTLRDIVPNEIFLTDKTDEIFVTDWQNLKGTGSLLRLKLNKVSNPIITKTELLTRFYS